MKKVYPPAIFFYSSDQNFKYKFREISLKKLGKKIRVLSHSKKKWPHKKFSKKNKKNFKSKFFFFFAFSFLILKNNNFLLTFHGSILRNGRVIALSGKSVCAPLCAPRCTKLFFFIFFSKS